MKKLGNGTGRARELLKGIMTPVEAQFEIEIAELLQSLADQGEDISKYRLEIISQTPPKLIGDQVYATHMRYRLINAEDYK